MFMIIWEERKDIDDSNISYTPQSRTYNSSGRSSNPAMSNDQDIVCSPTVLVLLEPLSVLDERVRSSSNGRGSGSCVEGSLAIGLAGEPKGEKPVNNAARRCRVLSIFPGDTGGAWSRLVGIIVECRTVDGVDGKEERKLLFQVRVCLCVKSISRCRSIHVDISPRARRGVSRCMRVLLGDIILLVCWIGVQRRALADVLS